MFVKRERLKKTILENAWLILQNRGKQALNIREISRLSQCSLGTIYNVFENHEDILLHLNAKVLDTLYSSLGVVLDLKLTEKNVKLKEGLSVLGAEYISFSKKNKNLWKSLFEIVTKDHLPDWYIKRVRQGLKEIEDKLLKAFPMEEKKMHQLIAFFWSAMHGISSIMLNKKLQTIEENIDEAYVNAYVKHCIDGLVP